MSEIVFTLPKPQDVIGGGNATVPVDAPIQPPQAFVDCAFIFLTRLTHSNNGTTFVLPNTGIVSLDTTKLTEFVNNSFAVPMLDLSGNALSQANVNALLAWYAANYPTGAYGDQIIDLSGGTNAAPSGQGVADKATLIANGWTVTTN